MIVVFQHRVDGTHEEVRGVECFREDEHYFYLNFKKDSKVKSSKYIRRNVKLTCIVKEEND